jgi:hypothetical protein
MVYWTDTNQIRFEIFIVRTQIKNVTNISAFEDEVLRQNLKSL